MWVLALRIHKRIQKPRSHLLPRAVNKLCAARSVVCCCCRPDPTCVVDTAKAAPAIEGTRTVMSCIRTRRRVDPSPKITTHHCTSCTCPSAIHVGKHTKAHHRYVSPLTVFLPRSDPQRRFRILSQSNDTHHLAVYLREAAEKVELLDTTKTAVERQLAKRPRK